MVLYFILKCDINLFHLINLYFHTFNLHLQVSFMQRKFSISVFIRSFFPDFRACLLTNRVKNLSWQFFFEMQNSQINDHEQISYCACHRQFKEKIKLMDKCNFMYVYCMCQNVCSTKC